MKKNVIKLNENGLKRIISESLKNILSEDEGLLQDFVADYLEETRNFEEKLKEYLDNYQDESLTRSEAGYVLNNIQTLEHNLERLYQAMFEA